MFRKINASIPSKLIFANLSFYKPLYYTCMAQEELKIFAITYTTVLLHVVHEHEKIHSKYVVHTRIYICMHLAVTDTCGCWYFYVYIYKTR